MTTSFLAWLELLLGLLLWGCSGVGLKILLGMWAVNRQILQEGFTDLMGYIKRLVDLYNRDLADGLDRLIALLSEADSQKSVEPFSLDVSAQDGPTEQPALHGAAYLVDMARVEALHTLGETRKAVELLDRHA